MWLLITLAVTINPVHPVDPVKGEDVTKKKAKQSIEDQSLPDPSRRSFFNKLWAALGIVVLAELAGVVFVFLRTNKAREASGKMAKVIEAGPADGFALNSVTA